MSADPELLLRLQDYVLLRYPFAGRALVACIAIGVLCGVVGTLLVLRRLSLLGDALGHATLPGLCLAFLFVGAGTAPALLAGALVAALLAALSLALLEGRPRMRNEASVGIILALFFAMGVVLLSWIQAQPALSDTGLRAFLLGNVAGITQEQLWVLVAGTALVLLVVFLLRRTLLLSIFDSSYAAAIGHPSRSAQALLLVLTAVAVVLSIRATGVILVAAMLIIPPSAALLLSRRLPVVMVLASFFGALCGWGAALLSFLFAGWSTGPVMVLLAAGLFAAALAWRNLAEAQGRRGAAGEEGA